MTHRTQPQDYYLIRDRVLELMADQAGMPFDTENFRNQFRIAAAQYGYRPFGDGYLPRFIQVKRWVKTRLPKQARPSAPTPGTTSLPIPTAWRNNRRAWNPRDAQLPPSDRE